LLGEAILSQQASDDAGSIHLVDTRSARSVWSRDDDERGADESRWLFRVDGDNDEGEEGEESDSDASTMKRSLDQDQRDGETGFDVRLGMGHARPRISRVDIFSPSSPSFPVRSEEEQEPVNATSEPGSASKAENGNGLSAQAGAIIGIHNMFIVIPQFLVTGLSSIIFALLDPDKSVLQGYHPGNTQSQSGDGSDMATSVARGVTMVAQEREGRGIDSIAVIFRLGGIAAAIAFVLSYRLAKDLKRR